MMRLFTRDLTALVNFITYRGEQPMVVIRLARGGSKKRPFYSIVVADKRNARDGRYIERLGTFNPVAGGQEARLTVERDKLNEWVAKGAQMSERVQVLVKEFDKQKNTAA